MSITFVDELRDFDVEKSGKNRRRRAKWSWFAAIAEENGFDVDPTEIAAEPGSQSNSSASESEAVESKNESIEEESSEETISSENFTEESDESDESLEKPKGDRRSTQRNWPVVERQIASGEKPTIQRQTTQSKNEGNEFIDSR